MAASERWQPHEDELLERLRAQGVSLTNIAKQLPGRTRNAVMGRADRMGFALGERDE